MSGLKYYGTGVRIPPPPLHKALKNNALTESAKTDLAPPLADTRIETLKIPLNFRHLLRNVRGWPDVLAFFWVSAGSNFASKSLKKKNRICFVLLFMVMHDGTPMYETHN